MTSPSYCIQIIKKAIQDGQPEIAKLIIQYVNEKSLIKNEKISLVEACFENGMFYYEVYVFISIHLNVIQIQHEFTDHPYLLDIGGFRKSGQVVHPISSIIFRHACDANLIDAVRSLLSPEHMFPTIATPQGYFRFACMSGYIEVAKEILKMYSHIIMPMLHADYGKELISNPTKNPEVVEWLSEIIKDSSEIDTESIYFDIYH